MNTEALTELKEWMRKHDCYLHVEFNHDVKTDIDAISLDIITNNNEYTPLIEHDGCAYSLTSGELSEIIEDEKKEELFEAHQKKIAQYKNLKQK